MDSQAGKPLIPFFVTFARMALVRETSSYDGRLIRQLVTPNTHKTPTVLFIIND